MKRLTTVGLLAVVVMVAAIVFLDSKTPVPFDAPDIQEGSPPRRVRSAPPEPMPPPAVETFEVESMRPGAKVGLLVIGEESYRGLTIANITAENVTLRDDRNIVSIPKISLPENVQQMIRAYLAGEGADTVVREGGPAFPADGMQYHDATGYRLLPPPAVLARDRATARQIARDRMENWMRFERPLGLNDILPLVVGIDIETPMPMAGAEGRWRVRGRGYVATSHAETGGEFRNFEVTVTLDREGNVRDTGLKVF